MIKLYYVLAMQTHVLMNESSDIKFTCVVKVLLNYTHITT